MSTFRIEFQFVAEEPSVRKNKLHSSVPRTNKYVSLLGISSSLIVLGTDLNTNMTKTEIAIIHHVTSASLPRLVFCSKKKWQMHLRLTELQELGITVANRTVPIHGKLGHGESTSLNCNSGSVRLSMKYVVFDFVGYEESHNLLPSHRKYSHLLMSLFP